MVHGQEHSCWFVPFLEQGYWKIIQAPSNLEEFYTRRIWILCNVALFSISTTRIWKEGYNR
uniref:Uncharacterized protein n=1 Tax=Glycine max TaxID=3847 RepID=C6TK55_SOYBN|nr:unknown [Glycine max]